LRGKERDGIHCHFPHETSIKTHQEGKKVTHRGTTERWSGNKKRKLWVSMKERAAFGQKRKKKAYVRRPAGVKLALERGQPGITLAKHFKHGPGKSKSLVGGRSLFLKDRAYKTARGCNDKGHVRRIFLALEQGLSLGNQWDMEWERRGYGLSEKE